MKEENFKSLIPSMQNGRFDNIKRNYSVSDVSSTNTTIDIIANAPIQVSISSNNQFSNLAKTGDEITLSMEFDENVTASGVYIGGNISASVEDLGGEQYEALYQDTVDSRDSLREQILDNEDLMGEGESGRGFRGDAFDILERI